MEFPRLVTPFDPLVSDVAAMLQAPNAQHWLGTDRIGRDVLSRVIYGARYSLLIGLVSMIVSLAIGLFAGLSNRFAYEARFARLRRAPRFRPFAVAADRDVSRAGHRQYCDCGGIAGIPKFGHVLRSQALLVRRADYVTHAHFLSPCVAERARGLCR
ncbi:Dipeptide transport system permease protein DppC [Candidatus Burkholderia pumila]|uniref:Dipeptide transport system permease protein DppC n=1 Tax=Candidatus Burkholderia pumila TaxID=1090375 RepID=A0ABR5HMC1_9BURK|nr:Dipeptide transport system permease protein DppC [Candidatus Burkholderia pumila]